MDEAHPTKTKPAGDARRTTDHDVIRRWAEARDAVPSRIVPGAGEPNPAMLRFSFPGASEGERCEPISWDDFFQTFEEAKFELVYRDRDGNGALSQEYRIVPRMRPGSDHQVPRHGFY